MSKWYVVSLLFLSLPLVFGALQGGLSGHPKEHLINNPSLRFSYANHTYEVSSFREVWHAAKYYCRWRGMELAIIETQEEQEALTDALSEIDSAVWISLNDQDQEGYFVWEPTGQYPEYTNWDGSGNSEDFNYVFMANEHRRWVISDHASTRYLCESTTCNGP